jgi:hypothetical protein
MVPPTTGAPRFCVVFAGALAGAFEDVLGELEEDGVEELDDDVLLDGFPAKLEPELAGGVTIFLAFFFFVVGVSATNVLGLILPRSTTTCVIFGGLPTVNVP